jgi:molybdopterin-guanine dinucleotide biosynthesis protein A
MEAFDAIVLAGGGGRRLGGVDKAVLTVGARSLLDRALEAVGGARHVVVVGPTRELPRNVRAVRENPPGGGPVAAIAAAVPELRSGLVVVLACDMPFVTAAAVEVLVTACAAHIPGEHIDPHGVDGAQLVDPDGRRQYLAAAYRVPALTRALREAGPAHGQAMRNVVSGLTIVECPTDPEVTLDCDTWSDVERSRDLLEDR